MFRIVLVLVALTTLASTERVCDDGWVPYNNQCYLFSSRVDIFPNAMAMCSGKGSNLVEVRTAEEEAWICLQSLIRRFTILWIGLTDVVNQNKYVYPSSGRKPIYTNWDRGQPEIGKKEDCAALQTFGNRKWHDYPCNRKMHYICKKPAKHYE
uniref:Collectin-12 n=1 Tax=Magallana gigas TaxID=29159 RepID=K1PWQ3_MAGGI|eukprot:XP_011415552.1 PREDICTED: collectin-12 [Crassostrea gigas]